MKFELEAYHRGATDEQLISELRQLATDLNVATLTRDQVDEKGKFHTATYVRRFGTWFKALELAGLAKSRSPINISHEELFRNLEEVWVKLGKQPRYAEMHKPLSEFSAGTYENRFGTWRKALERFVAYVSQEEDASTRTTTSSIEEELSSRHRTKRNINWRLRFVVMRRDNFKCRMCGRSPATDPKVILHVDHIKAWANGGETVLENLQSLCSVCNIGKSDME